MIIAASSLPRRLLGDIQTTPARPRALIFMRQSLRRSADSRPGNEYGAGREIHGSIELL
jgi:hypothetical protein